MLYLMDERKMDARAIETLLYTKSGLLGVSGVSSDMRVLLASPEPRAALAVDLFVYRIARELGSLAAALGGLDAIVFTGGHRRARGPRPRGGLPPGGLAGRSRSTRRPTPTTARASAPPRAARRPG